jgi:hypothetical protein
MGVLDLMKSNCNEKYLDLKAIGLENIVVE